MYCEAIPKLMCFNGGMVNGQKVQWHWPREQNIEPLVSLIKGDLPACRNYGGHEQDILERMIYFPIPADLRRCPQMRVCAADVVFAKRTARV